jgi:hypothetical protein
VAATYRTVFDATTSLMLVGVPIVIGALVTLVMGIGMLRVSRGTAPPWVLPP